MRRHLNRQTRVTPFKFNPFAQFSHFSSASFCHDHDPPEGGPRASSCFVRMSGGSSKSLLLFCEDAVKESTLKGGKQLIEIKPWPFVTRRRPLQLDAWCDSNKSLDLGRSCADEAKLANPGGRIISMRGAACWHSDCVLISFVWRFFHVRHWREGV